MKLDRKVEAQGSPNWKVRTVAAVAGILIIAASAWRSEAPQDKSAKITKIRVASTDTLVNATPFFVADKLGYFKEAGLNVEYFAMSGGAAPLAAAMRSGQLDVSLGAASQFMADIARGVSKGKIIGEFVDNSYNIIGGKGINSVEQLKGKIFGVVSYNSGDQIYSIATLPRFGIRDRDVTWLPLGSPPARLAALSTGRVDAIEIEDTLLTDALRPQVIVSSDKSPIKFVATSVFARQDFVDANRPALSAFLRAIGRASVWIKANPDKALPMCVHGGASLAACTNAIKVGTSSKNPYTWSETTAVNAPAIQSMIAQIGTVVPRANSLSLADFADTTLAASER
ncbi:ABC transporter substrate-binding protein [Novosphingobium flavum]|uniref:ABC transporter substrate-binding protein n=1 Tax=Novosphingobium flavum TaxID=1778672 RepID=A0A7X1KMH3_9SPHN|nr:ABC transporter substrate-binding protein [Novosphingobium flavum]MBC2666641.1 ABC transporter substrate-binding protein [Novosphingobium flavum]